MSHYDLYSAWFRVADWCAYDLAKDGYEGVVLQPLGQFTTAATTLARAAAQSANYMHRKIAASLAGWICEPDTSLLDELFCTEVARDTNLKTEDVRRLDTQSVVEDIVFAATRWARQQSLQHSAFELLTTIVERTIEGEYWNTSSYAMTTLVHHSAKGSADLLARFQSFANGTPPQHPCSPSLTQERTFAENLLAGNPRTLAAIERVLDDKDLLLKADLDENSRSTISNLCDIARQFEEL